MKDIIIGKKTIGVGKEVFISAEVGTTHNGSLETAKKLVDAALYARMDAVKFQILGAEEIESDPKATYTYKTYSGETKTENLIEMTKKYKFSLEQWRELKEYADTKGILMFVTVDYPGGVDIGEIVGMPAYKICSWDLNYYPLIEKVARLNKLIIFDLGPAYMEDLTKVLSVVRGEKNDKVIVLHCSHAENPEEANLRTISYIRDTFGVLSGFSSNDRNFDLDFAALAFQPVMIEKRLTLDKSDTEHHHSLSLEPEEMKEYVEKIRSVQSAIGRYAIIPSSKDLDGREKYWRRIVANTNIKQGEVFTKDNIDCKRPRTGGLDPSYYDLVLGSVAKRDLKKNDPIKKEDII